MASPKDIPILTPAQRERVLERFRKCESGCWEWTGTITHGYGVIGLQGRSFRAHRVVYELLNGKIPDGLTLDHRCDNKRCVNPEHLKPETAVDNARRWFRNKKFCDHGHPLTRNSESERWHRCKACAHEYNRNYLKKKQDEHPGQRLCHDCRRPSEKFRCRGCMDIKVARERQQRGLQ